jgi:cytochrome P450
MVRARQEIADDESGGQYLPYLRATVLESLRLWPTTPMVLRQTTKKTPLGDDTLQKDTGLLIYAPYFHRDERRLPFAHRFAPETWEGGKTASDWPLVPFSDGPGICPGRNVVLLTTSAFIARVIGGHELTLASHHKDTMRLDHLPATLDNFRIRFRLSPRA